MKLAQRILHFDHQIYEHVGKHNDSYYGVISLPFP